MKISVLGADGKMGSLVIEEVFLFGEEVVNKISRGDNISKIFDNSDVVIDFSCSEATEDLLKFCKISNKKVPIIIGTTGLEHKHFDLMKECARVTSIFYSPNMSFVVALMNFCIQISANFLSNDFDVEILDIHHNQKKDAPSGTAIMFGKTIAAARKQNFADVAVFARAGQCSRNPNEIDFAVQRCGNIAGKHEISFVGQHEQFSVKHEAFSRKCFAKGAIKIAQWIVGQKNGFYEMKDFIDSALALSLDSLKK